MRKCCVYTVAFFFFFNDTATTEIYTLSLHDALPISYLHALRHPPAVECRRVHGDMRLEEHTSELQSHSFISYAVFCLKKKKKNYTSQATLALAKEADAFLRTSCR